MGGYFAYEYYQDQQKQINKLQEQLDDSKKEDGNKDKIDNKETKKDTEGNNDRSSDDTGDSVDNDETPIDDSLEEGNGQTDNESSNN